MAGLYFHIPYCRQACHYCDFHFSTQLKTKSDMVRAMQTELTHRSTEWQSETFETIYFGGGTPSQLKDEELQDLLDHARQSLTLSPVEVTLEVNPEDVTLDRLQAWKAMGINRLSVGVQTLSDDRLTTLNRAHQASDSKQAIEWAAQTGFDHISIDLIYGIPGLKNAEWKDQLIEVLQWPINHLSSYGLTIEPNTVLGNWVRKGKYAQPTDTDFEAHFTIVMEMLAQAGWDHYEISNWCKTDNYARHNTAYWKGVPYLGIGPGAHSYRSAKRSWNVSNNPKYIQSWSNNMPVREEETLSPTDLFNEQILIGLRTKWGVDQQLLRERFGPEKIKPFEKDIQPWLQSGHVIDTGSHFQLTHEGRFLADYISSQCFSVD